MVIMKKVILSKHPIKYTIKMAVSPFKVNSHL